MERGIKERKGVESRREEGVELKETMALFTADIVGYNSVTFYSHYAPTPWWVGNLAIHTPTSY